MSIEVALVDRLLADAPVAAIASSRTWQLKLPQNPQFPAVRVQLISEPREYHLRGGDITLRSRIQVDAFATEAGAVDPYLTAVSLANAVEVAITVTPFTQDDVSVVGCFRDTRTATYEPGELRLVRIMQDFIVWWKPV